ncbi:Restriction of telomere capping protein 1 [Bienertia sinuspersici]
MVSKWRKAKLALGCIQLPRTTEDEISSSFSTSVALSNNNNNGQNLRRLSDAANSAALSPTDSRPTVVTPTPSSSGLRLSRTSSKSSKRIDEKGDNGIYCEGI